MNQHHLNIEARFRPETLERILRVVRHRGFQISQMNMGPGAEADHIHIDMTLVSSRSIELLSSQLCKLIDVADVIICQPLSQQIRA